MKISLSLGLLILVVTSASAHSLILDQSVERYGGYASVGSGWLQAQTFTVGINGNLVQIEAKLRPGNVRDLTDTADVQLFITRTYNGVPSMTPLDILASTSAHFPSPDFETVDDGFPAFVQPFQWVQFHLPGLSVSNNDQLAMVLKCSVDGGYQWATDFNSDYAGGSGFAGSGTPFTYVEKDQRQDYSFRTYVTLVPEPTVVILLGTAAIGMHISRRQFFAGRAS